LGIIRIFSQLYFERRFAYSLCASFVTGICLFIVRDVPRLHVAEQRRSAAGHTLAEQARPCLCGASHPRPKYDLLPIGKVGLLDDHIFAWRPSKQELIQGERT
jgi:hypothetical protein